MHRIKAKMKAGPKVQNTGCIYFYVRIDKPFL